MTPERHARAKQVFLEAVAGPEAQREAIIARACAGDEALAEQVRALLAAHTSVTVAADGADKLGVRVPVRRAESDERAGARELPAGTVIAGRYRIVEVLGAGGMGEVFRADDLTLGQAVALKFLPRACAADPRWVARLRNEARLARTVTHPNVCRVHDLETWEGEYFLSMEYIAGEDLGSLLHRIGRLPQEKAIEVARQTAYGLAAAHAVEVLHRDLKPANILLDAEGQVKITDFGIAALAHEIAAHDIRSGTAAYMAPEQITGRQVSVQSDLYALGLVMYELFTGRAALSADSLAEWIHLHQHVSPARPGEFAADMPAEVEQIILRCLRKDPRERPGSALAVAAALPGSDVLGAALAAQITPGPELVAAAATRKSGVRAPVLGIATAAVLALTLAARWMFPLPWDDLGAMAPAALKERARSFAAAAVPTSQRSWEASGYCEFEEFISLRNQIYPASDSDSDIREPEERAPVFWFRASEGPFAAPSVESTVFGSGRMAINEPSSLAPGMTTVVLDRDGKLLLYAAMPRSHWNEPSPMTVLEVGFDELRSAAGIDARAMKRAVNVSKPPPFIADDVFEWTSADDDGAVVAMGMARAGRPTFFSAVREKRRDGSFAPWMPLDERRDIATGSLRLLFVGALAVVLPVAWRAARRGGIDHQGGLRVAGFIAAIGLLAAVLRWGQGPDPYDDLSALVVRVLCSIGFGAIGGVFYIVVDRFARRYWPDVLITWNRAVRGQWRDADVREHVGLGVCGGCVLALLPAVERAVVELCGWSARPELLGDRVAEKLYGVREALASVLFDVPLAIAYGLLLLVLLVGARWVLRRPWEAVVAAGVVLLPILLPRGASPQTAWLFMGVCGGALMLWLLTRVGLLALVAAFFVSIVLNTSPLGMGAGCWHSELGVGVVLLVGALAVYGIPRRRAA